jgi:hypothetical protein
MSLIGGGYRIFLFGGYLLRSKFDPKYPNSPNPVFSGFNENSDGKAVTGFFKQGLGLDNDQLDIAHKEVYKYL